MESHQPETLRNSSAVSKSQKPKPSSITQNPSYLSTTLSTQIINSGGKNSIFNENFRLNVRTINASLKCEIWMLSRIRNYLED